jgi:hypothetical protein
MERLLHQGAVARAFKRPIDKSLQSPISTLSSLDLDFACETDDAGLRRLLRTTPMPGSIQISLEREPSYFGSARAEGGRHCTFCARDRTTGSVIAMGCRVVRELYVNGRPQQVGYLSQLRIAAGYRHYGRSLLSLGFCLLNKTRANNEAPFDITTIVAGNRSARRLLECGLPNLPRYTAVERILTFLLPARSWSGSRSWNIPKEEYSKNQVSGLLQFAPVQPLPGPIWDQRAFKQIVIRGYSERMRRFRRLLRLPPVGSVVPAVYLTENPPDLNQLTTMKARARGMGARYLAFALAAGHPWTNALLRHSRAHIYESILYVVHQPDVPAPLDGRCAHVEAALL